MIERDRGRTPLQKVAAAIVTILVVMVVGAIVRFGVREGVESAQIATLDAADLERELNGAMSEYPHIQTVYGVMRNDFPNDWENFLNESLSEIKGGASSEDMRQSGFEFMRNFTAKNAALASRASSERLSAIIDAQTEVILYLRTVSPQQCAKFGLDGSLDPKTLSVEDAELLNRLSAVTAQVMYAIRDGKLNNNAEGALIDDAGWEKVATNYQKIAGDTDGLLAIENGTIKKSSEEEQCSTSANLYKAIQASGAEVSAGFLRLSIKEKPAAN
jgi:hypothetical protein